MLTERRAQADVGEAPRHEIAGGGAQVVRLALWRFERGLPLGDCNQHGSRRQSAMVSCAIRPCGRFKLLSSDVS